MVHVGDITALSGYGLPPVDVVSGGSPCQDLSVAGKRAGLAGERSGLFMEQIRVVKELRDADIRRGRAGVSVRPRFMLWENVPGAFSSNGGEDFRAVLEETVRIAEPDAPDIPRPKKWPIADAYFGDGWSVAYRVLDAQLWGVPQRRRRIALVADFGGHAAPEILFVRASVSGDSAEGGTPGKGVAGGVADCAYPAIARSLTARGDRPGIETGSNVVVQSGVKCLNPWDSQSGRVYDESGAFHSLNANENGGMARDAVFCLQGNGIDRSDAAGCNGKGWTEGVSYTLNTIDRHAVFAVHQNQVGEVRMGAVANTLSTNSNASGRNAPLCYDARGNGNGRTVCTLTRDHENRITDYTALCVEDDVAAVDCRNGSETETNGTLQAKGSGGYSLNTNITIRSGYGVRRLTPLECERLQGFPDGWTDIGDWKDGKGRTKKTSDAARYKALGNSIAIPPWAWVMKRICACYERPATLASLFDGIGGFPLIWERLNGRGSCLWASEIEEFPIAVTKLRFGG